MPEVGNEYRQALFQLMETTSSKYCTENYIFPFDSTFSLVSNGIACNRNVALIGNKCH